jgi:hypothetical protein
VADTIVARVCLNLLRSRTARRERPIPDPIVSPEVRPDPEAEAVLADTVRFAPAERLAFVLHDIFDLPFDEIANGSPSSPVGEEAIDQVGAVWMRLSRFLTIARSWSTPWTARLPMLRLRCDHTPSVGLRSGA